jgi:hypothetical protein
MLVSTGHTKEIMDVVDAFGWKNLTIEQLETLLFALQNYVKIRNL